MRTLHTIFNYYILKYEKAKSLSYSLDRRMENGIDTEKIVWIYKKYYGYRKKYCFLKLFRQL